MSNEEQAADVFRKFIKDQKVSCEECIYQSDRVIENAYELIADLASILGYYENEDVE